MRNLRTTGMTVLFAMVFLAFNVGLPIVVASCPMLGSENSPSCCGCPAPSPGDRQSISSERNSSCCVTTIASGRNLTEFVAAGDQSVLLQLSQFAIQAVIPGTWGSAGPACVEFFPTNVHSHPAGWGDVRLLVSSLII